MNPLAAVLASIDLGPVATIQNLAMIPLLAKAPRTAGTAGTPVNYLLLEDALAAGLIEITEVSEEAGAPDVKAINRGTTPVLVVDGEELPGATPSRVVNLTILVPPQFDMTIPVSPVPPVPWRARSRGFASAPGMQFATGRAKRIAAVSFSMIARGDRGPHPAGTWDGIADPSGHVKAGSPASAAGAILSAHPESLDVFVAGCQPVEGQVGVLFGIAGRVVGFDLFDRPSTLQKMLPKLVRGAAVAAIDRAAADSAVAAQAFSGADALAKGARAAAIVFPDPVVAPLDAMARQFLAVIADAPQHVAPALGLGEDRRLNAPHLAGAALISDQHVLHFAGFAL